MLLSMTKTLLFLIVIIVKVSLNQSKVIETQINELQEEKCFSDKIIKRFQLNPDIFKSCESGVSRKRRRIEPIFKGKPKPRADVLASKFHLNTNYNQAASLIGLIKKIAAEYLNKCPPIVYYDNYVKKYESYMLENLFKSLPLTYSHGEINSRYVARNRALRNAVDSNCKSYILFLSDPSMTRNIIGPQMESRVVVISRSTQWKLRDFLSSEKSSNIVNLLVIGESLSGDPTMDEGDVSRKKWELIPQLING